MNDIVIYPSKKKMVLSAFGALGFVALSISGIVFQKELEIPTWVVIIAALLGVPFFGFCFVYLAYRLLNPAPAVIVGRDGILDNASALAAGSIRWDEIEDIIIELFEGQKFLGIILTHPDALIARQTSAKALALKANRHLMKATVNIPQVALPISV